MHRNAFGAPQEGLLSGLRETRSGEEREWEATGRRKREKKNGMWKDMNPAFPKSCSVGYTIQVKLSGFREAVATD